MKTQRVSRERAVEIATKKAEELEYSIENHTVEVTIEDNKWIVVFVPAGGPTFGGGLAVVVDGNTGEVVSAKFQQ